MEMLTSIREQLNLTKSEFARRIGASPGQAHDWESGRTPLTVERAVKIEKALGITGLAEAVVEKARAAA
jgi:transcriptional regulator with XRE-family HTH domain